jgi:basic membrane protein A
MIFAMVLSACGGSSSGGGGSGGTTPTKTVMKVALVTDIGGLNDQGFNHLAYTGYQKAEHQYSFKEQVIQTQSQNDYVTNLTEAAQAGDLVIAVGFLMQTPIDQVAKQFPSKKFAIVDGCAIPTGSSNCETLPNVAPLFFKEQEAGCLVGAIAAQMEVDGKAKISKLLGKNTISAVGGLSIPPVNRYIAGYKYCAQKVDPSINVVIGYSQDFTNTAKCKDAALSQINQHSADIVFQVAGGCGVGALDAANSKGLFGIGVDADQGYLYPSVITSALKRVDVAVYDTIDSFQKGNYTNNPPKFDLNHDGVGYAPVSKDVPADAQAKAQDFANQIKAGSLTPPENIP